MLSVLLALFSLVLVGVYCFGFKIVGSSIIKNERALEEYLGVGGGFQRSLKTTKENGSRLVNRLRFLPQNEFKLTDNCIQSRSSKNPFFCFEEKTQNGQMIIKIFPNEQVIQEFPKEKDRLLNLNLLGILESSFGIASDRKNIIVDHGEDGFIFTW